MWRQMKNVAEKSINDALGKTLLGYVTLESQTPYPYSTRPIYSERWNETVENAISNAADGAQANMGIGYASQQQIALSINTIFCNLLDAKTLKVTKRLAGKTANILHYNLVIQYREILEHAYRIEPEEQPIATAEIRLNGRHWEAVQVRGIHNQVADQATFTAAILLANHYTEAWAKMQRSEHDTYRMVPAP